MYTHIFEFWDIIAAMGRRTCSQYRLGMCVCLLGWSLFSQGENATLHLDEDTASSITITGNSVVGGIPSDIFAWGDGESVVCKWMGSDIWQAC